MTKIKQDAMITPPTLQFLEDLSLNNDREWFHAHANAYAAAKQNVLDTAQALIAQISRFDASVSQVEPKRCLFRIARDTRFANDKSPYKTNFGLLIHALGTKSKADAPGYYLHIQPGHSSVSCGVYCSPPDVVRVIRKSIYENWEELEAILHPPYPVPWTELFRDDDALTCVPNGFPKDHPAASCLMLKHFYLMVSLRDKELQSSDIAEKAARYFETMLPFKKFIEEAIKGEGDI